MPGMLTALLQNESNQAELREISLASSKTENPGKIPNKNGKPNKKNGPLKKRYPAKCTPNHPCGTALFELSFWEEKWRTWPTPCGACACCACRGSKLQVEPKLVFIPL